MADLDQLLICSTCGTQFDVPVDTPLKGCNICDDPRQFVPPGGQVWTCMAEMKGKFKNRVVRDAVDERMWNLYTEPKFAIGQRAILLQTEHGNILWDMITLLDDETIESIKSIGGLKAIVISHPHYYATHLQWAEAFECPVYIAYDDQEWLNRRDSGHHRTFIKGDTETVVPGVTAIKTGGHFDGSLVLHWDMKLFIADTFVTVPSGLYHVDRPPGTASYVFMWSIPNMIPLPPAQVMKVWKAIKPFDFEATHGAFVPMDIRHKDVKKRVLESMKIQVRAEGWQDHELLAESVS